jgi:lysophospholipase L1-like esterase
MRFHRWMRILLIATGAALAASVALNVALGFYADRFYRSLAYSGLDPLGIYRYPDPIPMATNDPQTIRVVFLGDSRAEYWPAPQSMAGFQFINRGVAGQTSEQVLGRFDAHLRPLSPDIVVIQVGINDLQAVYLFPERREWIVERCKANIRTLVEKSLGLGAAVVLTTIFPHGPITWDRAFFWSADVDAATAEVNALIVSLASEQVIVFDTAPVLQDERGLARSEYQDDFLHLNAAGYEALNVELSRILE